MARATCDKCNGTNIRSRTNYYHGRKSTSITTLSCKNCGSTKITVSAPAFNKRGRR